jgi:hypothetical protein
MKRLLITLLLCFSGYISLKAQQGGWMRSYHFDSPSTIFSSLVSDSNSFWVCGLKIDASLIPSINAGLYLINFDYNGDTINSYIHFLPDSSLECWNNDFIKTIDSKLKNSAYSINSTNNELDTKIVEFNLTNNQLTVLTIPRDENSFRRYQPTGLLEDYDGYLMNITKEMNPPPPIPESPFRSSLIKVDKQSGAILWEHKFPPVIDSSSWVFMSNVSFTQDSLYLTGYVSTKSTGSSAPSQSSNIIRKINRNGQLVWNYVSPANKKEFWIAHIQELSDRSIVYATNFWIDKPGNNGNYTKRLNGRVVKIDTLGNRLWERNWGASNNSGEWVIQAVVINEDESVVSAGANRYLIDANDSIQSGYRGYICKTSQNGDSAWSREYVLRNFLPHWHNFTDIKATPDGGYLLCGRSTLETTVLPPGEQYTTLSWIVKTDSYGCVVPGCHLVGLEEKDGAQLKLKVYPNPASEFVAVWLPPGILPNIKLSIRDVQGKTVYTDALQQSDATYLINIERLSKGLYFMEFVGTDGFRQVEKVVKE